MAEAYTTGRGSFRVRAKWATEEGGRGTYVVVITEIPWLVQKSRLIEKIAELLNEKKLPLVADVRDESAEDVRIVIEPRARTVDAGLMMESLFKLTELESRIPLNMNVLVKGRIPKVLGLAEVLREWLDHRRDVLVRRSQAPAGADRAPARSARRLSGRLSQPRQGHQDHPQRGRAQARPDEDLQAHRSAGRRHPQHAAAQLAQARGDGDPLRGQGAARGAQEAQVAARLRGPAVEDDRRPDPRDQDDVRAEDRARPPPHRFRRCADARRRRDRRGDGGARADHRRRLGEGLGARVARPRHRPLRRHVQE